jgi:hypothetical protein
MCEMTNTQEQSQLSMDIQFGPSRHCIRADSLHKDGNVPVTEIVTWCIKHTDTNAEDMQYD